MHVVQSAKAKAKEAQQAKAAVSWQLTMAAKVAGLMRSISDKALGQPPAATPGKCTYAVRFSSLEAQLSAPVHRSQSLQQVSLVPDRSDAANPPFCARLYTTLLEV